MFRHVRMHAFTLVELLVVVAIIALLLSILLPALSRARLVVQGVACLNNLRSFSQANAIYQVESNGWNVPHLDVTMPSGDDSWHGNEMFRNNVSGPKRSQSTYYQQWWPSEYLCPLADMAQNAVPPADSGIDSGSTGDIRFSYGYNRNKLPVTDFYAEGYVLKQAEVQMPASTMQFVDALNPFSWWHGSNRYINESVDNGATVAYRHPSDTAKLSYFDGHAGTVGITEISRDYVTSDELIWKIVR